MVKGEARSMSFAVGVKFGPESFPKFYKPTDLILEENDFCVVLDEEKNCERVGYVACFEGRCAFHVEHLKPIVRRASEAEIDQWHRACRRQREALAVARGQSGRPWPADEAHLGQFQR